MTSRDSNTMAEEAGDDDGFYGYVEDTVDPGPWLLLGTTIFCFLVMLLFVPLLVLWKINRRQNTTISIDACDSKKEVLVGPGTNSTSIGSSALKPAPTAKQYTTADTTIKANLSHEESQMFKQIFRCDQESSDILKLAIPLTVTALSSSTFSNICIILVSQFVGTKAVAAFALVQILVGLTDGMLHGPIYACSSLCAHAVGAGNSILAGQYIQLSILIYLLVNIPVICFWWTYMYEAILYLEWGDADTALQAQEFVRIYIWSVILSGVSSSIWQLLEVTGHAVMGTIMCIFWHLTKVALVSVIVTWRDASLWEVGLVYVITAVFFVGLTWVIATMKGWFKPFTKGMTGTLAFKNTAAVRLLLQQGLPLAMGSLLSNAEWAVLTFFASHLGSAEVTTWAILGSIWDVFYSSTQGIGDAAEIRVAYHLGENQAVMAKISAYKSLLLGMMVASFVSIVYFSLQSQIPLWFSSDETIQAMLAELVPFVGVANLTMTFGMQCWSLIGAQGKYQLATWISFLSSWGITMPMAAIFVFWLRIDLQGLTSAVVIGYVATGASLSYVLLSSDWDEVAKEIEQQNREPESTTKSERLYASMKKTKSSATKATVRRNVMLLTVPAGRKSGILLGKVYDKPGTHILLVRHWSPLFGKVKPGDIVLALDGLDVSSESAEEIATRLRSKRSFDRQLVIRPPPTHEGHRMADLNAIAVTESQSFENMSCSSV